MASGLEQLNEDSSFDDMTTLTVPLEKAKSAKSPNLRRHFSEGAIHIDPALLHLDRASTPQSQSGTPAPNSSFDISTFSGDDPIAFSRELQTIISSIKNKEELPPRYIMVGLMDALEFWMSTHGVPALSALSEHEERIEAMQHRHDSVTKMQKDVIEELSRQCRHDEQVHIENQRVIDELDMERNDTLSAAKQQLQSVSILEQQIFGLQSDVERKSSEIERKSNTVVSQQKVIDALTAEKEQNEKMMAALKLRASKWTQTERALKAKEREISELKQQCKEMAAKYHRKCSESDRLFGDKALLQRTLADFGKIKDNLAESRCNEQEYRLQIKRLREEAQALRAEKRAMIDSAIQQRESNEASGGGTQREGTPTPTPSRASSPKFVRFTDGVRTYNASEKQSFAASRRVSAFDESEFEEFQRAEGHSAAAAAAAAATAESEEDGGGWDTHFGLKTVYRSLAIVTVSCLVYLVCTRAIRIRR